MKIKTSINLIITGTCVMMKIFNDMTIVLGSVCIVCNKFLYVELNWMITTMNDDCLEFQLY